MRRSYKGLFVTLEGADKTGKSTQVMAVGQALLERGYDIVRTFEPGGTELGYQLRDLLFHYEGLSKATELLLFNADRAQHYKEVIRPALKEGKIILCDRYFDSTLVYQGAMRKWNTGLLYRLHGVATGCLMPDITFLLDGSVSTTDDDVYDVMDQDRVRKEYLRVASIGAPRVKVISANQPREVVTEQLVQAILIAHQKRQRQGA